MITEKRTILQPLIDSADGVHLSIYLARSGEASKMEAELQNFLESVSFDLRTLMSEEQGLKFLQPISALLEDSRFLEGMRGNLGIFRSSNMFRMISIPIDVQPIAVIASTFHVKPLLHWMQVDRDFLLLHIDTEGASLYQGSQSDLQCKERLDFVPVKKNREGPRTGPFQLPVRAGLHKAEKINSLLGWILDCTQKSTLPLYVSGEQSLSEGLLQAFASPATNKPAMHIPAHGRKLSSICLEIRAVLRKQARQTLEQAFIEFQSAEEFNLGDRNIFQIAKAAIEGRVKKLIVADGIHIFGRINPITGNLNISSDDTHHKNDDILDDLAQTVLHLGGEVLVANKSQIPRGRPALAILYDQGSDASLTLPYYDHSSPPEWRISV